MKLVDVHVVVCTCIYVVGYNFGKMICCCAMTSSSTLVTSIDLPLFVFVGFIAFSSTNPKAFSLGPTSYFWVKIICSMLESLNYGLINKIEIFFFVKLQLNFL
jgi:hypothetical protein